MKKTIKIWAALALTSLGSAGANANPLTSATDWALEQVREQDAQWERERRERVQEERAYQERREHEAQDRSDRQKKEARDWENSHRNGPF